MSIPPARRPNLTRTLPDDAAQAVILGRYRQFVLTVGLFAALTVGFYGYAFSQFNQTQFVLVPAVISLLVLSSPFIFWLVRRGRTLLAGVLVLVGLAFAYAGNEAAWTGLTVFHLIGGVLLILIAGSFILPRRVPVWVAVAFLYLGLLWGINTLDASSTFVAELLGRISYESFPLMLPFSIGSNVMLGLAFIAQVLVEFQARTLRTRLLVILIILTFVPVAAVSAIASILSANDAQQQKIGQMEAIGTLKEAQIQNWLSSLQGSLQVLAPEGNASVQVETLLTAPKSDANWQLYYQTVRNEFANSITFFGQFETLLLLDLQGRVVLSTRPAFEGSNEVNSPYFSRALQGPVNSPVYESPTFRTTVLVIARPLTKDGTPIGVLAGLVSPERLGGLMEVSTAMGSTGEVFLMRPPGILVTPSRFEGYPVGTEIDAASSLDVLVLGAAGETLTGSGPYTSYRGLPVLGYYRWLPSLQVALFAEQAQQEALGQVLITLQLTMVLAVVFVILAFVAGLLVSRRITAPLVLLSSTAARIAEGNLNLKIEDQLITAQQDEIGELGRSFNTMTGQLRQLFSSMEAQVDERTADLERRSAQLQIAAEVARDATAIRDLDELLKRSVDLLRERFLYYHAGIFLVDERGEYAVLAAATGEAGRKMLARGHRLKIGETGMVGNVTRTGQPRVANDVRSDPTHYVNPDLPDTQAEVALPLRVGSTIIGAVDVQSINREAFSQEVIDVLQIVTDQLAVAISSARLVRQQQETLEQLEAVYGEITRSAWTTAAQRLSGLEGYRFSGLNLEPLRPGAQPVHPAGGQFTQQRIPLRLRDQEIGEITLQFEGEEPGPEAQQIYSEIGSRLVLLLENARLLQEAQNLASREQQINAIATGVRSSVNLDSILRNTVREIGLAFGASRTYIQLMPTETSRPVRQNPAAEVKED